MFNHRNTKCQLSRAAGEVAVSAAGGGLVDRHRQTTTLIVRTLLSSLLLGCTILSSEDSVSFNRDVRPILSDTCFFCHGPDSAHREADLRLDVEQNAKEHAIVPGDLSSELITRITTDDPDLLMPPTESGKRLTEEQIGLMTRWVRQGAPYEAYWAYVRPEWQSIPQVQSDWPRNRIDNFILEKLDAGQMVPSADTDRRTLIRRVTFDLTGLPPLPEEVEAFVNDSNPLAYQKLVDGLLASPAYGERMAVYWLDLVRFADTVGYHGDQDHNISPYRDYVIDALNDDMPLDRFTREQIAGDLMPEATVAQQIATGYNRLLQTSHEGGVQPKEYLTIYAADRIRNVSNVWMGATVGCAQCHDHKYDPYTTDDFYSMVALFADIDEDRHFTEATNNLPTKRPPEISVLNRWQRERSIRLDAMIAASSEDPDKLQALDAQRESLKKLERLTMVTQSTRPRKIRVLARGDWMDDSGPVVEPSIPQFLGSLAIGDRRATRLDFANWLVDAEEGVGGMTARVFANRLWYLLFGRGISSSLDDFGGQGEPPSHPELLDQLAIDLIEDDWSIKRFMRRLVSSRSYRQSSLASNELLQTDPNNRWFARQSRYRMPAEMVRDNVLMIGGLLVSDVGGRSVKPYQPSGYYRHLNFPKRTYVADTGSGRYRRGVYVHWQRQYLHPMLKATDAPSREECTAQRPRSNTPLEALVMLNDPSMIDAAIGLSGRVLANKNQTDAERLESAFYLAVSRGPSETERSLLLKLLEDERKYYREHHDEAKSLIGQRSESQEQDELASWTSVSRALLNMYETVSRN